MPARPRKPRQTCWRGPSVTANACRGGALNPGREAPGIGRTPDIMKRSFSPWLCLYPYRFETQISSRTPKTPSKERRRWISGRCLGNVRHALPGYFESASELEFHARGPVGRIRGIAHGSKVRVHFLFWCAHSTNTRPYWMWLVSDTPTPRSRHVVGLRVMIPQRGSRREDATPRDREGDSIVKTLSNATQVTHAHTRTERNALS